MSKSTIARITPTLEDPSSFTVVANDLHFTAARLRTIAQALYDDAGESLAGAEESDVVYPYFEIMLDAIRTEAARIEKLSDKLFASPKAVAR